MCPLCRSLSLSQFQNESFLRCQDCALILKNRQDWPSAASEKARYLKHENTPDNLGYIEFLKPVIEHVKSHHPPGSRGLDFGCGPRPVLAEILGEAQYLMEIYDPFFFPRDLDAHDLDFVTCTEVLEHVFDCQQELTRMFSLLHTKGELILQTQLYKENQSLSDWFYTRDLTHVNFHSEKTLRWIARHFQKKFTPVAADVFSFTSP